MSGEFEIIAKYFAPLAADSEGAFGLKDDVARLSAGDLVVTKDVLVEGVHFFAKDPIASVAKKALRVNLSDLAAKGARPCGYFLGCVWPLGVKEDRIADFAAGLAEDQAVYKIALLGGDTTVHGAKGAPLVISITMVGAENPAGLIRRNGAAPGDDLWTTGTIGDAGLGLAALQGDIRPTPSNKAFVTERFRTPSPRTALGGALAGLATASIDVSDGLIADAGHIASQSGVALEIAADKIPLSDAAQAWVATLSARDHALARLATFGDDYEILFSAPPSRRRSIEMASQLTKTPVARIGVASRGAGVALVGADGARLEVGVAGFDHFSS